MLCKFQSNVVFLLCFISVMSSNLYQRRTDLEYRRQISAFNFPVPSISVCASTCEKIASCVSFFFNILNFLCQIDGKIYLSFDFSDAGPWHYYEIKSVNVALKKSVSLSTEYNPPYHDRTYAVDGRVVLDGSAGQCVHTQGEINPWIVIDLGSIFNIKYVTLFNRIDDNGHRLHDVFVSFGETNSAFTSDCGTFKGPGENAEVVHIVCQNTARGQFVKIQIKNLQTKGLLTLCEVRVSI